MTGRDACSSQELCSNISTPATMDDTMNIDDGMLPFRPLGSMIDVQLKHGPGLRPQTVVW